jgi:ABC-type amino acid transport system permease subunit
MTILTQVKAILAGMIALIAAILFLVLDHTAVMSVIRRNRSVNKVQAKGWRRFFQRLKNTLTAPECLYGMAIGATLLTAMFILAGGGIPYLPWIGVPFLGALFGLVVANNTEKISPVSIDEVTAGESLGLSFDEVMREIVIPNGRPGLLQKLNRRKMKFK